MPVKKDMLSVSKKLVVMLILPLIRFPFAFRKLNEVRQRWRRPPDASYSYNSCYPTEFRLCGGAWHKPTWDQSYRLESSLSPWYDGESSCWAILWHFLYGFDSNARWENSSKQESPQYALIPSCQSPSASWNAVPPPQLSLFPGQISCFPGHRSPWASWPPTSL